MSATREADRPCEGYQNVPYQGWSCPAPGGWEVVLDDGLRLFTHGPDRIPPNVDERLVAAAGAYTPFPPTCSDGTTRHIQYIYAYPSDQADSYQTMLPELRNMANRSNGHIRAEAQRFGDDMSLRFRCDASGLVNVTKEKLNFTSSQASFNNIVNGLRARGYKLDNAKYLIFYHGSVGGGIAGQGHVYSDDSLSEWNLNNNGQMYAINYGYTGDFGAEVSLHEMGHNLGAVQNSAPNGSGGMHCNDDQDTMCYNDGGSNSGGYRSNVCTDRVHWDCNNDDYFHPSPPTGSYLRTHWNLASRFVKFMDFGARANQAPEIKSLSCSATASRPNETRNCGVVAYDPDEAFGNGGGPMTITVDWGDGTQTLVEDARSGSFVALNHSWSALGEYTLRAWAVDNGTPPLTSAVVSRVHAVACTYRSSNNLLLGLNGLETAFSARTLTIPCAEQPFRLTGNAPNDFDVCWYAGAELLRCDANEGNEAGMVPAGADGARVILRFGANGAYNLFIDPPAS